MQICTIGLLLILTFTFNLFGQSKVVGHYWNHFFSEIQLNADSTFEYNWHLDLHGSWTKGTWRSRGDTIYFHVVPIYDTLSIIKNNGMSADSIILSKYSNPRRITPQQLTEVTLQSIEQNRIVLSEKMVFKENKLYEIKDGRLVTEKRIVIKRGSESDPWYFKSEEQH
ncbi:hypothetical protein [Segetibacter aerophilus]|uniref:Uncharacterized protein n=1 Tax=Segetibacter aerophilus TaxID=670293 RepID=A0A512BJK5_9BACT|nr:hypothetical protein [Segetibacter aerophilus]GEO12151.1 hypothetical protein SAE01_46470 [Segetibacter aerophilus]